METIKYSHYNGSIQTTAKLLRVLNNEQASFYDETHY